MPGRRSKMTSMANCSRFSARRPIYRFRIADLGFRRVRMRVPRVSADVTIFRATSDSAAASMARETCGGDGSGDDLMVEVASIMENTSALVDHADAVTA